MNGKVLGLDIGVASVEQKKAPNKGAQNWLWITIF